MTELKSHVPEGVLCHDNQAKTVLVAEDDRTHSSPARSKCTIRSGGRSRSMRP